MIPRTPDVRERSISLCSCEARPVIIGRKHISTVTPFALKTTQLYAKSFNLS